MSMRYESDCVDCGLPCLGRSCPNYLIKVCRCDACGEEIDLEDNDGIHLENGADLCYYCAREMGILKDDED